MNAVASDAIVEVLNPFGKAESRGIDLLGCLERDPLNAGALLDSLVQETKAELESATNGVFYRLFGATPAKTTPMQYGGFFLERDRELLDAARPPRILFIEGTEDVYFDFVGDLPAELFGFDIACGVPVQEVRAIRKGPVLADSAEADVRLSARSGPYQIINQELVSFS